MATACGVKPLPSSCRTKPGRSLSGARDPLIPSTMTRMALSTVARVDGQNGQVAETWCHHFQYARQTIRLMDERGAPARFDHARHEARPIVEARVRHGVGRRFERAAATPCLRCRRGRAGWRGTGRSISASRSKADNADAGEVTDAFTARRRLDSPLRAMLPAASAASSGSRSSSTPVTCGRRVATQSATVPAPAPISRMVPGPAGLSRTVAASSTASTPARYPWRGCLMLSLVPEKQVFRDGAGAGGGAAVARVHISRVHG